LKPNSGPRCEIKIIYLVKGTSWFVSGNRSDSNNEAFQCLQKTVPQDRSGRTALHSREDEVGQEDMVLAHFQLSKIREAPVEGRKDQIYFKIMKK
jgi:hypothetical protein